MKKLFTLLLVAAMLVTMTGCKKYSVDSDGYTYHTYTTTLATNWNEHTWETNADSAILTYITTPFVDMSIKDSVNNVYQWTYKAATDVTDVTATHQDDLTKYKAVLPEGQTAADTKEGYVFEIKLNKDVKWETGEKINADNYVSSFKQLLDPKMKNYRANLYYAGESAVAGGAAYFYQGSTVMLDNIANANYTLDSFVKGADGSYTTSNGENVYIALDDSLSWLSGDALSTYVDYYGAAMFNVDAYNQLRAKADEEGHVPFNDETKGLLEKVITFSSDWGETVAEVINYTVYASTYPEADYDSTVGMYKVDDYTIIYVTNTYIDLSNFMTSLTSNWVVDEKIYNANKDTTGTLVTTSYCTSLDTTKSYGPYKMTSLQDDKQMVFEKNEYYYAFKKDLSGRIVGTSNWEVDGKKVEVFQADKIVMDVMTDDAAKQAFLKGEIDDWTPAADELPTYSLSDNLYKEEETYTMAFFFNTNLDMLKEMDKSKGNTNSVVLSNTNFRKGFSLGIDRAEWVGATAGYKPSYGIMNDLYFYDIYNDPTSSYRGAPVAKQAICNLYNVEFGDGKAYKTLDEAYASITGYNLTEAKACMKSACEELVAAGLYTAGEDITIRVAYMKGAMSSSEQQQVVLFNKYINAAAEGSGFGKITLEAIDNITDRYSDVPAGEFAIGYGAWGGAFLYPFRNMQVYCDPDTYSINEIACWDPTSETLTIKIDGTDVTMTWQEWSNCCIGTGKYATAPAETKLMITATMEEAFLNKYYRIPLASSTACSMLSYKVDFYTKNYNIMYAFGGFELLSFNYTNSEWTDYVSQNLTNGQLSYE